MDLQTSSPPSPIEPEMMPCPKPSLVCLALEVEAMQEHHHTLVAQTRDASMCILCQSILNIILCCQQNQEIGCVLVSQIRRWLMLSHAR